MITSPQSGKGVAQRTTLMEASVEEHQIISKKLFSREMFMFIRTTGGAGRVGLKLRTDVSSGLLWVSTSNQADIDFRREVVKALGKDEAYRRLARFFKGGQVKSYFEGKQRTKCLQLAQDEGYESTFEYFYDAICLDEKPKAKLAMHL